MRYVRLVAVLVCCMAVQVAVAQNVPIRQLAAKSQVTLPETAGAFHLEDSKVGDGDRKTVQATYSFDGAPKDLTIVLLVSPEGRAPEKDYVKLFAGTSMGDMKKDPTLTDASFGPLQSVDVPRPRSFLVPDTGPLPGVAHGLRQAFRFRKGGVSERGVATYIYRDLHGLRLMVLGPQGALTESLWNTLPQQAAESILRAVDIRNFGACGKLGVGPEDPSRAREMMEDFERTLGENCAESEASQLRPPSKEGKTYTITN